MSEPTRDKWNRLYAEAQPGGAEAAAILSDYAHLLPAQGTALDFACGLSPDGLFLAHRGLETLAVDISDVAADKLNGYASEHGLPLRAEAADLLTYALPSRHFDVIVVVHYLERDLAPTLVEALKPGGLLFYQTFTRTVTPDYSGPRNESFRLADGELLQLFAGLTPVVYREEGLIGDLSHGLRNEAQLIAQRAA